MLTSFIVFLMMTQRTRDFGLIKAAGCPNSLVGGYFMTELLIVTFLGCILGVVFGFLADFVAAELVFSNYSTPFFWFAPLVFAAFFVLSIFFGLQPLLKASRISPIKALSFVNYYGLTIRNKHKALSQTGLSWRLASRSLIRRQSAAATDPPYASDWHSRAPSNRIRVQSYGRSAMDRPSHFPDTSI